MARDLTRVELADMGHPRAQNLPATWQRLNQQAWQFLQSNIGTSFKQQQTTISSHPTVCDNDSSSGGSNAGDEENDPTQRLTANTPEELSNGKLTVEYSPGDTLTTSYSDAPPGLRRQVFEAFCLQIRYDKVERRIEISATISEAVAEAFENAKDLPEEVSSVTTRDIAGARYVPPSDARVVERMRQVA